MADRIDQLFGDLQSRGFAKDKTNQEFRDYMLAPGKQGYENRKQFFEDFKSQGLTDLDTYEDFASLMGLHAGTPERRNMPAYQPTDEEMAGFQSTINSAGRAAANPTQSYDRKADLMKKRQGLNVPQTINLGESNNLTPTEQRFNPETGEMEQGYMTGYGNEYDNRAIADMEQRAIDQQQRDERYRQTLPGQLEDAYAERDRINAELAKFQGSWVDQDGRVHYANRGDDESVASLEAALRQNEQRITALEAERDDDGGTQFWRGFIDAASNRSVQTFGLSDFDDMLQLMRIKSKIDTAKASGQEPKLTSAEQQLMESSYLNNYAQSTFGENRGFMYRAGGISMQALPFVAEFMMTGGFSALSEKGAELGTRAAEKLALEGLKKTLVKNLGVVAGDVAAGWAMANTTGLFRTAGDIMQRNVGQVAIDENGNLGFEGGKSLGRSIYEAEVANTLEYYTEKLGEHLKLGKRLTKFADKHGLTKLSKAVNYLSGNKWLERGGIQDYPSEVIEEQANLLLNATFVGDNTFSSPDDPKSVINKNTQLDIWGGMLFSIGLMQAPQHANTIYNAAGYYAFKKNVDISDADAAIVFGRDNWDMVKEQIDNCDNDQLPALLETVVNGDMTDVQKRATMNYAGNLIKMRGYNMGSMAGVKDEEESSTPEAVVKQTLDQGYQAGREAQDPDEKKLYNDEAVAAAENLKQYGEAFTSLVTESNNPSGTLNFLMNRRESFSDEEIVAAADFFQKQARASGMMDAALDKVDLEVEKANAFVRENTHQATNNVVLAKGDGDMDYYVIGGDIVTDPDTGMTSLVGTGGAVIVKDSITGEVSVKSPQEVMVYAMRNADELIQNNETALRQQLMQQADDDITFGSPANEVFELEDTVTLQDGEGGIIDGTVVTLPNAVDGVFVVQTSDGRALQMTADDINRRIVAHNGMEVQRATQQPVEQNQPQTEQNPAVSAQNQPVSEQNQANLEKNVQNAGGEAGTNNGAGANEPSALSRIPVRKDSKGEPLKNKKGKPILDWHKASVEDASAALIETTGGDMLMARDTASDLVKNAQADLERIRKQKPKGSDPIEIAESRMEIKRQEQEQQAIIKQWQDVNQRIQKQMRDEEQRIAAEREAAKSEEQRQREAEEARIRKEEQDKRDRERIREQIEKDKERRNKEYQPLVDARTELAGDADALAILNDTEPRSLDEWVSSLLRPHSMLWQDASQAEVGLQSELGLKRGDMQRMMTLLGTKENGAKPFGKVVLDIYEGLPDAMKQQYTDEDVRRTLLDLFSEGSSTRMLNLTQEHRIEEARQMAKENEKRDAEAEMEAWAEHYHLTAEERETFEDWMQLPPTSVPEQEIINQIIADNESNRTSVSVGQQPVSGAVPAGIEGGEGEVQAAVETPSVGDNAETATQDQETATGQPSVSDNNVSGEKQLRDSLYELFRQIGAEPKLAYLMSLYEVEQLTAMVDEWDAINSDYGFVLDQQNEALKSKDKKVREEAQAIVNEAQQKANEAFEPIEQYIEGLNVKWGIENENEEEFEGAIPTPQVDKPRYDAIRQALIDAYRNGDAAAIMKAAQAIQQYVDEGLDSYGDNSDIIDIAEDYNGNDPVTLADQYITRTFWSRYLDDDVDPEYIKTGLKPDMRIKAAEQLKPVDLRDAVRTDSAELGVNEANARARYQLSATEKDAEGNSFYEKDGSIDLWSLPQLFAKAGRQSAPIRLTDRNLQHILDEHHKEIGSAEDVFAFLEDIFNNAPVLRRARGRAMFVVVEQENTDKAAIIKLMPSDSGDYYNVETVGYYRKNKWKDYEDVIADLREPDQSDAVTDVSKPQIPDENGREPINAETQTSSSEGKDTKNTPNNQENSEKSSKNSAEKPIGKTSSPEKIAEEEAKVDTNPTDGQKEAGNYQKGHINIDGYDITIENPKGSVRSGVDSKGNPWESTMHNTYGYIRGTEGVDGDHIDVFLSDNPTSGSVFVVDQVNPDTNEFDEHKVMYGFASEDEAREAYLSNYAEGWQGLGNITEVSREEFKKWVESSHRKTKPFAEYKNVKKPAKKEKQHKRIVSDDQMEELRKKLRDKFGTLNAGIDVERMLLGAMYAVGKIERGVTKFADYAAEMVEEIGDAIRPYLKAFYNAVRDMPEAADYRDQMDSTEYVEKFDVYNFDKKQIPNAFTKAEQVVQENKAKKQVKKVEKEVKQKITQGDLFAGDLFGEPAVKSAEQPKQAQKPEVTKFRPATEADIDSNTAELYYQGKRVYVMAITRSGEQTSATTFSEPTISSVLLTNGKSVKVSDLKVKDDSKAQEKPRPKNSWWNDANRPQSLDPSDYKTYMTPEAKEYFSNYPIFTGYKRNSLAFVTAAVWDGVELPPAELKKLPEIIEAEQIVKDATANGVLKISDEERDSHARHLLDAEHGSAVFEGGKIRKVNGVEDFSGPVRQEKKALVIIGLPAGGKSSVFANPLSYFYGARIIDSDVVKPWLDGFDDGNGAGYVQDASSDVAERALDIAVRNGDNIILPRIGGKSVVTLSAALRLAGYDVELYYNDVKTTTSVNRATSRFAETGRYLSLDYLTSKDGVPSNNFSKFAEKKIGDYLDELSEGEIQKLRGRLARLLGSEDFNGEGLRQSSANIPGGYKTLDEYVSALLESGRARESAGNGDLNHDAPLFSYAEWKSNDVAFGEKPKEIWNSKSGKPIPGKKEVKNNESKQEVSRKPESASQGAGQASGAAESAGTERSSEPDRVERSGSGHSIENVLRVPDEGEETRDSSGGSTGHRSGDIARGSTTTFHKNRRNNVGERGKDYAPLSPKARFNANVEAIKLMRVLMDEGIEAPTKDQMEVLRQYSGWGGLGTYFNDETSAENKILRDLLDEDEYNDAAMSINSAYFTPAWVIDGMWDIARAMGFTGGNVLEGSAGIGNIIGQMPKKMSSRSDIEAVEIDKISGNILKLLYPDAKVHIQGFQDTMIRNGSVDLAITNVPFVTGLHVFDKVDKDLSRRFTNIHDFCIAKNIRKLREGGIGIFISSSNTLDKSNDLRAWITDEGQADVVGAFRLDNETFGGTKATSDIIVVRKRVGNKKSPHAIDISKASPLRVGTYTDKWGEEHQVSMTINDYFKEHPEMMPGEMAFGYEKGDTFRPGSYGLYPMVGKQKHSALTTFALSMGRAKEDAAPQQQPQQESAPNQLTMVKEGRMLIDENGRLCVSQYGEAVPLNLNANKVKGYTKEQCFNDYQDVQKAVDDVLQQQLSSPDDAALKPKLDALNKAYDKFVKRYGYLHKNTAIAFLRNDIDFPTFLELEKYSETKDMKGKVTVTTKKAPLFTQRVLGFKTEPKPKSVKDALIASIFRTNSIDLEWITAKLNEVAAPPNGENWTTDDVRKGILVSRLGFENPSTGQLEVRHTYLSGNVREKLAIAEAYNKDGQYAANVEELRKVVPMDIPSHLIDFTFGSSWIPNELYIDYLRNEFGLPENIKLTHLQGTWALDVNKWSANNETNKAKGVYSQKFRVNILGSDLAESALNNRPYKVSKQETIGYGADKTTRTVVDQEATSACNVRIDEIKDSFKQYIRKRVQDDTELARRIEKIYNDKFNALVPLRIDDEMLPERFEDANMNINLYDHQKRGVLRGVTSPTMLAHEVGTGKSFTLISTAMEMRRLGTANKPMIVVQNATVAQMTADAKLLYPNAKVLSLSEKDRDAEGRRAFYAKIRFNDWDMIIIPQSTLDMIPDSPERELQFIQEQIDEKKHIIEMARAAKMDSREIRRLENELKKKEELYGDTFLVHDPANNSKSSASGKGKKRDAKREAASLDKAETKAREKLDRNVDDVQYFDDLGVDAILVDEAHGYKHLGFDTTLGRSVKGVDPSYSKKCAGLYNKTRAVFEKAGWKNVVFATGTPISNTAAEIWTFMKYLLPADVMKANDIYYFDDFVHNFGSINQMLEFKTNGKFNEVTRFAAYVNRPELMRIWMQVADIVRTEEVGEVKSRVPEKENGKDQDVFLPQSPSLVSIMAAVRAELERFEKMDGKEKRENSSIPLTMYGIAKRAAIDPRLVDATAPDEPTSKTNAAVKEIVKDLDSTKKYKGTVAVFCDNQNRKSATGGIDFNIFEDMKEKLVKQGVPEAQIAIIKSSMSIGAKQKIFDKVNTGDVRVILGSTQTLGTGVNIQERLHLLIHMDAPDRPMDYTQRNGRIERQGNLHKEWGLPIRILRFGVEDSLDVTAYQRLKTKSGFIDSIMNGKSALANNQTDRTIEEEEEGLFDNPVAVLSGSQFALKKNQAERQLRKMQGKYNAWEADQIYVSSALRYNESWIKSRKEFIDEQEQELAHMRSMFPDGKVKTITVQGVPVDMTKDSGEKILSETIKEKINEPVNATVKKLRENQIYNDEVKHFLIELDGHAVNFEITISRVSEFDYGIGKMRTVVHKTSSYKSPDLHIEFGTNNPSSASVREHLDNILDDNVSGTTYTDAIEAANASIKRTEAESKVLKEREGQPFQFTEELEQAKNQVEEYTKLMKKEMEEKEAKYAEQAKEAGDKGGFDLKKAEDNDEDEDLRFRDDDIWNEQEQPLFRDMDIFAEGQTFPIRTTENINPRNILGSSRTYSTDLMPDEYASQQQLLDAVRNQYPAYYASIEDGEVKMQSWEAVLAGADIPEQTRKSKGAKNYIERKTRNAINAVEYMAKQLNLDVEVLTTTEGLTGKKARSKGWFNPKTHKIVIVLPNNRTQSDCINTLLHEGVAHYGLRNMFGKNFDTFLDNVYNNVTSDIKAVIDAAAKRGKMSIHEATEEYLARLAERTDFERAEKSGWWQKIKDFFLEMLSKVGFDTTLTDNELRYILWRSYDHLLHPDYRRNVFDDAKDIQMKSKLKVGDYAERVRIQRTGRVDTSPMVAAETAEDETELIVARAKADGTYMLAPNGKPSNLNEKQWAQVRTKAFKDWFGDWENDPENASKVVDENGEPKVMYHGTNLTMVNQGEPFWTFYPDSHFGTRDQAGDRVSYNTDGNVKVYEVFLNIRNPQRRPDADQDYLDEKDITMSEYWQLMAERTKSRGNDGIVYLNEYEGEIPEDSWIAFNPNQIKSATDNNGDFSTENDDIRYSIRTKEPPKKIGKGYKVFVLKDGQLYPPMVANPGGEGTPIGVWLDADAAPVAGTSKTGRPQVKAGGKGTQGGSGQLAYRPGWHLGTIPYALQFGRKDENGERTLFPNNFVWAEVEYADDVDYNDEARQEGMNANGKYQHSLAGLKHVPTDGSYMYRTNPDPRTDPWIITGAMRVHKILTRAEVDELVRKAGREPQQIQDGDIVTDDIVAELNEEIKATEAADEMGLLYRDDSIWDDVAQDMYEKAVAQEGIKLKESWQDSMVALKLIQNAIAAETGKVATGAEDAYRYENRMHGRAKNMTEQYDWRFYRPMLKAFNDFCKKNGLTHEQGMEYLISKSGLERNIYYSFRDGAKAKITEEVKQDREKLEKDYEKRRISEADYVAKLAELSIKEQDGADELMKDTRQMYAYQHAKDEYEAGNIGYTEYLRIIETVIRGELQRRKPKKDADGHIVSTNYYDDNAKDWSGLTETFAKDWYDLAQQTKKQAQRTIDPQERRALWAQYDKEMRQAYEMARQTAEDAVFGAENGNIEDTKTLWRRINDATKQTLKHSYEGGLIDRTNYNKVREMFDYYIPLRGWEEDKASDVYTYMGRDNVFSPAVKKTWGRTSRAENPLAYIGNIAVSTILSGHRNLMKQHFLNYVMNNPTTLVSISESWYENIAPEGEDPVWILRSADTAGKSPDEIAQIVNDFNEEMQQKQREGKAMPVRGRLRLDVNATKGQKAEHVVEVQRAGRTYQLYINGNPKAAQALNGSAARAVSRISDTWLGKKITKINRDMAMFFTSKNPAFVVSNLSRDLNMAGASVAINEGKRYNARFIANVTKVLRPRIGESSKWVPASKQPTGMMPSLMRKWQKGTLDPSNEVERYFGEFMDEGGETGFVNMLSIDSFKEKMKKELAEMNGSSILGKGVKETSVHKGLRLLGDTFEFYNRCAEDATRFIVYMTSRQMGKTLEESIADAKDVTLNFNRKGTGAMGNAEVRDLFIFVNPAIQALANMFRMAKGHPLKFGAVTAAFVAGGALMPILNQWFLNMFGDDDDKQSYWNLPPWVRKNNLVFWLPFTKNFVTMPLAQEFRVFYGIGEMISSAVMDHPVDKWGLEVFSSVADLVPINPTGNGGNLMVDFAPTMIQPLMQVGENIDFTGKPIWRENQGNKYAPMYEKAYISTPAWMVRLSEGINDVTGGNEGKKGVVERNMPFWGDYINNPAVWNHLLQGYFGGMYNTIAKTFDVGVTAASGELPKIYQTPVINRFLNRPVERDNAGALGEDYYNLTEQRDALQYELRTWQKKAADGEEGAQEHVDEILDSPEWKRAEVISHYEKIMKDLKAGERAATESADKLDIKESIALYKQQMNEELNALDEGKDPLDAAVEAYSNARTFAEKNRLRMRIERLTARQNGEQSKVKGRSADVEKALSYITDDEKESRTANEHYLELATAENVRDDARIKAAKAKIKKVTDEYKKMVADGKHANAAKFREKNAKYFAAEAVITAQSRAMATNKKLLGKGSDKNIMRLLNNNRSAMLRAIESIE